MSASADPRAQVIRPRVRVGDSVLIGPGKIELMRAVAAHGSISAAARALGIGYKRAWSLLSHPPGRRVAGPGAHLLGLEYPEPSMKSSHRTGRRSWLLASLGLLSGLSGPPAHAQPIPTVAAAADLKFALEEVAAQFERASGQRIRLVFGSSGTFLAQLLQGAPFHLFMSADEAFVFKLADAGKTRDRGRIYAIGRIGIIVPHGSPIQADPELKDLAAALKDGRLKRFAIANPEHAPYGARAQEALTALGLWDAIRPRLVYGENIAQTAQFATSGSAQGGIIALSLASAPAVAALGSFALLPEHLHQPLVQRMVLLKDAPAAVVAFYDYLSGPAAQAIMTRYGFAMPRS